jgi:hypothetical protein
MIGVNTYGRTAAEQCVEADAVSWKTRHSREWNGLSTACSDSDVSEVKENNETQVRWVIYSPNNPEHELF